MFNQIGNWFNGLFNKLLNAFKGFIEEAFSTAAKIAIAEFKDFAKKVIVDLEASDLTNTKKRAEAFRKIKEEAIASGKELGDSLIYTLIELAIQHAKTSGEIK